MRKLLQFPNHPAVVYLHWWSPSLNQGQRSFWRAPQGPSTVLRSFKPPRPCFAAFPSAGIRQAMQFVMFCNICLTFLLFLIGLVKGSDLSSATWRMTFISRALPRFCRSTTP